MTSSLLRRGVNWLNNRSRLSAGEEIVYCVGPRQWPMTAVPLTAENEVVTAEGLATIFHDVDWQITQDDLDARRIKPAPGHWIIFGTAQFEVLNRPSGKCIEPVDQLGVMVKVHTTRTKKPAEQVA